MLSSVAHKQAYRAGIQFDNLDGAKGYTSWGAYGQSSWQICSFRERTFDSIGTGRSLCGSSRVIPQPLKVPAFTQAHADGHRLGEGPLYEDDPSGAATQVYVTAHPSTQRKQW